MYEKILVPLDGSVAAEMVIPYVEEIAAEFGSRMIVVSVSEPMPVDLIRLHQTYLERITEQVQHRFMSWQPGTQARLESKVLIGKPAYEILHYADECDVGLIAMTSRGSSVHGPWLLGNIAAKVLRATTRPLLLIRAPAGNTALQPKRLIKRVLIPLDGSELGAAAIPHAKGLGRALNAELVLFQVLDPVDVKWINETQTFYSFPLDQENRKLAALNYLDEIGQSLRKEGLSCSCGTAWGSSSEQIIDYAQANSIDLIAMSTHGRSGISRWVFGSIADKILHAGDTAVLVVRAPIV